MKASLISFIGLPLLLIALSAIRFGVRIPHTLAASAIGEILGVFLYSWYKQSRVTAVLSGTASGAITYAGTAAPKGVVEAILQFIEFGIALGLFVLAGHWVYTRARSAMISPPSRRRNRTRHIQ